MRNTILDLAEESAHLCVRYSNLILKRSGKEDFSLPLEDIAVVVASNPQISCTQNFLAGLCAAGGVYITCDETRHPVGMMLPLQSHHTQTERMARQVEAKLPIRKRLWQQIVHAKIESQGALLQNVHASDSGLFAMAERVRSGDPDNLEAQAARRYWMTLFGDAEFIRDRNAEDVNKILNYGYAVLRAMTARAVCAAGLHPSIGLHHHNRYNAFTLADDVMEPFRPVVDRAVLEIRGRWGSDAPLDKNTKNELISDLTGAFLYENERRTLFDILARATTSLAEVFLGNEERLALPNFRDFFTDPEGAPGDG